MSLESFRAAVSPGDIYWGFRISPAANRLALMRDPKELPTQPLIDSSVLPHFSSYLHSRIAGVDTFEKARDAFMLLLRGLKIPPTALDTSVSAAVEKIIGSYGTAKIADVSDELGVNKRGLERRFRKEVGMTLKQYSRVFRLRSTAISLIEEDNLNWANRAAEMGFADQSHLIKEFIALTGRTPQGFSSNVENTDYKGLIS